MASILTNTSAMVALQTLKSTNKNLAGVQGQISTGLKIATAKDNASTWAIAQTMRSDVKGFKQIKDGLSGALAAVNVGRNATESITDLLTQIKDKVLAAGATGADTGKIQNDITQLVEQIGTVVGSASFNGLNFVNNNATTQVLAALNRETGGSATTSSIEVSGVNLEVAAGVARGALAGSAGAVGDNDLAVFSMEAEATGGAGTTLTIVTDDLEAGDQISVRIGDREARISVSADDLASTSDASVLAVKLKSAIEGLGVTGVAVDYDVANPANLVLRNDGAAAVDRTVVARVTSVGAGGLGGLQGIDLTDVDGRAAALAVVETALTDVIDAAARLGSVQQRLELQQEFIGKLTDNVTTGIGAMVDADMEEASARLQALQVQQQLGIQSLSIANQNPQSILALFR
jgi:flagellin